MSQETPILLLAVRREGEALVLITPSGEEFVCATPEELWDDAQSIMDDPTIPKAKVEGAVGGSAGMDSGAAFETTCDQVEHTVGNAYGPLAGKAAGHVARTGGRTLVRALRNLSRR